MRGSLPSAVAVLTLAAACAAGLAPRAGASIDASGSWLLSFDGDPPRPFTIVQSGGALSLSGEGYVFTGAIDPDSGAFSVALTAAPPGTLLCSVHIDGSVAASGATLSATYTVQSLVCITPTACSCAPPSPPGAVAGVRLGACGNGVVEVGEQCDAAAGGCCSPACQFLPAGAPCAGDGNACTLDACDGAGTCTSGPHANCRPAAAGARIVLDARGGTRNKVTWRWRDDGGGTAPADFGDPAATTAYQLCVFGGAAGAELLQVALPPGGTCAGTPCWTPRRGGFRLRDAAHRRRAGLRATARRARLDVTARGAALLFQQPLDVLTVRAQLLALDGDPPRCWEAVFTQPAVSTPARFKATR